MKRPPRAGENSGRSLSGLLGPRATGEGVPVPLLTKNVLCPDHWRDPETFETKKTWAHFTPGVDTEESTYLPRPTGVPDPLRS